MKARAPLLLAALTGCSTLADLGEPRELASPTPFDAGSDASTPIDAGLDRAPPVDATNDAASNLLFYTGAETAAPCETQDPPLAPATPASPATCNDSSSPLAGTQSIRFEGEQSVMCDPCWETAPDEIWVEALVRIDVSQSSYFLPFQMVNDEYRTIPVKRRTGAFVEIDHAQTVWMICSYDLSSSPTVPFAPGQTHLLTFHYSWPTGVGELWVRPFDGGQPSAPLGAPHAAIDCPGVEVQPTGWFAQTFIEPAPGAMTALFDEIRITTDKSALAWQ